MNNKCILFQHSTTPVLILKNKTKNVHRIYYGIVIIKQINREIIAK